MFRIPDWLKGCFGGAARSPEEEAQARATDPALMQIVRHELQHWTKPEVAESKHFMSATLFLDRLQVQADISPLKNILGTTPQGIRAAAGVALMEAVAEKKFAFFFARYERPVLEKQPVYVEDLVVPVRYFADHALALINQTQSTALAGLYEQTLRDLLPVRQDYESIKSLVFVNPHEGEWQFTLSAADPRRGSMGASNTPEIVLRHNGQ